MINVTIEKGERNKDMGVKFRKRLIDKVGFEACSVFDVNRDGIPDIVCGENWYEGPAFVKKHKICDITHDYEYYHDFSDYPMDVNGDGYLDIITGSWWGDGVFWRENPGLKGGEWTTRRIAVCKNVETIRCFDIDNCGTEEIFPNIPGSPQMFFKLVKDVNGLGTGKFTKHVIGESPSGHGMGFVDINGDGRTDIVLSNGWLEQPENLFLDMWIWHPEFDFGSASVPIIGYDVNGDGLTDLIVGQAHNYGLHWYEQTIKDGARAWIKHDIETSGSQYHDLQLCDIDNDGKLELITGARWRAHNGRDPGEDNPIGTYYFDEIDGGKFERVIIDYGDASEASGLGIYFWLADLNNNGWTDIVAPGKEGLYLFENLGE
jgi:hypothetical protein